MTPEAEGRGPEARRPEERDTEGQRVEGRRVEGQRVEGRRAGERDADAVRARVDALYRADSRRILATLIRTVGGFERAEEALHDAFAEALRRWPVDGVPDNPRAWILAVGRFAAIDALRRRARADASLAAIARALERDEAAAEGRDPADELADDRLRLIFTCCHPALAPDARVALTLREVGGLTTEAIARAFLVAPATIAQRIVRAKAKIRDERIPYEVPGPAAIPARLDAVLQVIYLVFNEGHHASAGDALLRPDLVDEAVRLGRLVVELLEDLPAERPDVPSGTSHGEPRDEPHVEARADDGHGASRDPEALGLLALMLLNHARRAARTDAAGELVPLEQQDRTRWDRAGIAEGIALLERALRSRRFGAYTLQAAIAAVHAEAPSVAATDWAQIVGLYDLLVRIAPSPVVALNRAVAVAMRDGPAVGLALVDALLAGGELDGYVPAHATGADLCRRLGRVAEARAAYETARDLTTQAPERRYFERRLAELPS